MQFTNEVSQISLRQFGNGQDKVGDVVHQTLRVRGLVKNHSVYRHNNVVRSNDLLRWHIHDLFSHVHAFNCVDERNDDLKARFFRFFVFTNSLYDAAFVGANDLHTSNEKKKND